MIFQYLDQSLFLVMVVCCHCCSDCVDEMTKVKECVLGWESDLVWIEIESDAEYHIGLASDMTDLLVHHLGSSVLHGYDVVHHAVHHF